MHSWSPTSIHVLDIQVQALKDRHPCPILREMTMSLPSNAPQYQVHETRLGLRLAYLQRDMQPILGDGACLFRAFSFVMTGSEDRHLDLRQIAVNHVCASPHLQVYEPNFNKRAYRASMSVSTTWPGETEMVALVEVLQCSVYIISSEPTHWYVVHNNPLAVSHAVFSFNAELQAEHYSVVMEHGFYHVAAPGTHVSNSFDPYPNDAPLSDDALSDNRQISKRSKSSLIRLDQCSNCGAWRDKTESAKCCLLGKCIITESLWPDFPADYCDILDSIPDLARESRMLNNSCAFVSIGTKCTEKAKDKVTGKGWVRPVGMPRMYGLHGRTYHYISDGTNHRSTHFYMYASDPGSCLSKHCDQQLQKYLVAILHWLQRHNAFAYVYRHINDEFPTPNTLTVNLRIRPANNAEQYVLYASGHDAEEPPVLSYMMCPLDGSGIELYSTLNSCGETGAYPLFFPQGLGGWFAQTDDNGKTAFPKFKNGRDIATVHQYAKYVSYQLMPTLTRMSTLYQQWTLDMFSRWQEIVFHYMANDENVREGMRLRLFDMKDMDLSKVHKGGKQGRPFAIPASVPDSPAARRKAGRECLATIGQLGNPDSWVTFTCNPKWREILDMLHAMFPDVPGNESVRKLKPEDLAHLGTRVYWHKFGVFKKMLRAGKFSFGHKPIWLQIVHEYQMRYWPHFHLLCRFENYEQLSEDQLNYIYNAQLFHYSECPMSLDSNFELANAKHRLCLRCDKSCKCTAHRLHRVVFSLLYHTCWKSPGGCRSPEKIRPDGTCDKRFPREAGTNASREAFTDAKGFFHPKRLFPEDCWVVPYNRLVLEHMMDDDNERGFFAVHNNWDQCSGAHTVEYVHEYQHKGPDFTQVTVSASMSDPILEFKDYQRCRHIGFCEAFMRFLSMQLHENEPSVTSLPVHLEGKQFVAAGENSTREKIANRLASKDSLLLRYFWRHKSLHTLKYNEYYAKFILDARRQRPGLDTNGKCFPDSPPSSKFPVKKAFERRGLHVCMIETGQRPSVEKATLSLILREFPRTSFLDCRTVDGTVHATFAEAAYALGIYSEYNEFEMCLQEMINSSRDAWKKVKSTELRVCVLGQCYKVRSVFITMIMNGGAAQKLFNDFAFYMTRDVVTRGQTTEALHRHWLLQWTKEQLLKNRMNLDDVGLEDPTPEEVHDTMVRDRENARVSQVSISLWISKIPFLHAAQKVIFDCVTRSAMGNGLPRGLFYLDAVAGCGKTHVCQCISAHLRSQGRIVLSSAPSALAASLHMAGTTCHKCFGLPIQDDRKRRLSSLSYKSYQGTALRLCDLIIIDEVGMLDTLYLDCIDNLLRELCGNDFPFGGKCILIVGQLAQLPPVVQKGSRQDIVAASVISSQHWHLFKPFQLSHRFRHADDQDLQHWTDAISIGEFDGQKHDGFFESPEFPKSFRSFTSLSSAVNAYLQFTDFPTPDQVGKFSDIDFGKLANSPLYTSIAIAFHHKDAIFLDAVIRTAVQKRLRSDTLPFVATETPREAESIVTAEWMSAQDGASVPPHRLEVFIGCKLRLLRNFNQSLGLCNGTMLILRRAGRHFLEVQIITPGEFFGNIETIFRFKFDFESRAFSFWRTQFPVRSAFSGTVHRFQGQGVSKRGILLVDARRKAFCHGHVYVAITRAMRGDQVILILKDNDHQRRRITCCIYGELSYGFLSSPFVEPYIGSDFDEEIDSYPPDHGIRGPPQPESMQDGDAEHELPFSGEAHSEESMFDFDFN